MLKKLKNALWKVKSFITRTSTTQEQKELDFLKKARKKYPHIIFKKTTDLFEDNIEILKKESEFIKEYDYCIEKYSMYFDNNFIKLQWKQVESLDKRQDREHIIEKFFIYQIEIVPQNPFFFQKIRLTPDYHDTREGVRKRIKKWIVKPASAIAIFFVIVYIISISTGDWSGIKSERSEILVYLEGHWQEMFRNGWMRFYWTVWLYLFLSLALIYGIIWGTYRGIYKPLVDYFFHDRVKIKHVEFEKKFDIVCENRWYASRLFNDSLAESMLELHKEWLEYITFYRNKIYLKLEINIENNGKSIEEKLENIEKETMRKMAIAHRIAKIFDKDFMENLNNRF